MMLSVKFVIRDKKQRGNLPLGHPLVTAAIEFYFVRVTASCQKTGTQKLDYLNLFVVV